MTEFAFPFQQVRSLIQFCILDLHEERGSMYSRMDLKALNG